MHAIEPWRVGAIESGFPAYAYFHITIPLGKGAFTDQFVVWL
jgi:hypothetical protein